MLILEYYYICKVVKVRIKNILSVECKSNKIVTEYVNVKEEIH